MARNARRGGDAPDRADQPAPANAAEIARRRASLAIASLPVEIERLPPPGSLADDTAALGVELEPGDADRLAAYLGLVYRANELLNLTAVPPAAAWSRHVLDALSLIPLLSELPEGSAVVDVGSGAGVPGVPLAIAMPGLRFTLLESVSKKAAFLREAVSRLGLANTTVAEQRAEVAGRLPVARRGAAVAPTLRETFNVAVARAVGRLAVIAELASPLVRPGGRVLLIKGAGAEAELAEAGPALELLRLAHAGTLDTPTGRVVVLDKAGPTPPEFPRADGDPARHPLGVPRPDRGGGRA